MGCWSVGVSSLPLFRASSCPFSSSSQISRFSDDYLVLRLDRWALRACTRRFERRVLVWSEGDTGTRGHVGGEGGFSADVAASDSGRRRSCLMRVG